MGVLGCGRAAIEAMLESYRAAAISDRDQDEAFEMLAKAWLVTDAVQILQAETALTPAGDAEASAPMLGGRPQLGTARATGVPVCRLPTRGDWGGSRIMAGAARSGERRRVAIYCNLSPTMEVLRTKSFTST